MIQSLKVWLSESKFIPTFTTGSPQRAKRRIILQIYLKQSGINTLVQFQFNDIQRIGSTHHVAQDRKILLLVQHIRQWRVIFVNENHYLTPGLLAGTFYQVRQLSVNLRIIVFCQVILLIVFPQSLGQILIQFSSGFVYSQFSTTRSGIRAKCPTLAVTITSPFCKAVAPIKRSKSSIRCPWRSNKAFMCP